MVDVRNTSEVLLPLCANTDPQRTRGENPQPVAADVSPLKH